jgi:iron complex transport system substrate-binding protein
VQGGWIAVDPEAVVNRNPDIIVKGCMHCGGYEWDAGDTSYLEEARDEIMSRSELQIVTAVREEQVYILSGYLIYGGPNAGCRGFLQTAYMAKWFHPELFEDLDPRRAFSSIQNRYK